MDEILYTLSISCPHPWQGHMPRLWGGLWQPDTNCVVVHLRITRRFLSQYCKEEDRRTLVDLFYQDDQFLNSGNAFVQDSYNEKVSLLIYQRAHSPYCLLHIFLNSRWRIDQFVLVDSFVLVIHLYFFPEQNHPRAAFNPV